MKKNDLSETGCFFPRQLWWFSSVVRILLPPGRLQKISMAVVVVDAAEDCDFRESFLGWQQSNPAHGSARGFRKKKKNLEMAIGIYWESASYHPRYTDILVGMKDLCFGASKKPLQPAPPTLHEFRPSWTDSPSLDQLGKMIQAALLWEHSWWRCVGLKNRVSSFRFPPVSTQKSQRPENTRNLPFSRGSKSQSHKLLARIFVESLVNCLGNGHSAWVDSLLDSVPCTKKSGTAE